MFCQNQEGIRTGNPCFDKGIDIGIMLFFKNEKATLKDAVMIILNDEMRGLPNAAKVHIDYNINFK